MGPPGLQRVCRLPRRFDSWLNLVVILSYVGIQATTMLAMVSAHRPRGSNETSGCSAESRSCY